MARLTVLGGAPCATALPLAVAALGAFTPQHLAHLVVAILQDTLIDGVVHTGHVLARHLFVETRLVLGHRA